MVHSFKAEKISCTFSDISNTYQVKLCDFVQTKSYEFVPSNCILLCIISQGLIFGPSVHLCPWPQSRLQQRTKDSHWVKELNDGIFERIAGQKNHPFYTYCNAVHHNSFKRIFAKFLLCTRPYIPQMESLPERKMG